MRGRVLATAGTLLAPVLAWGDTADDERQDAFEPSPSFVPDVTTAAGEVDPEPADAMRRSDLRAWSAPVLLWTRGGSAGPTLSALQDDRSRVSAHWSIDRAGGQILGLVNDLRQSTDGLSPRHSDL